MSAFPLLSTKLYFPAARSSFVARPDLVQRFEIGLKGLLTLVSAPAGYGKTTLVSEWRAGAGHQYPAAWLSLDAGDNDPVRFLHYLAAALETLQTGLLERTLLQFQSPQLPPTESILTVLLNDLNAFPEDFAIVLDDYHVVSEKSIHEMLSFVIEHQPVQMHLVLLTRSDPPLPLARLRARRQLVEIRARQMRFTLDEIAVLMKQVMGLNLHTEDLLKLEERTEGWIAGLQLAALSMQGRGDVDLSDFIAGFAGSHHYILDYLTDEVLDRQPEEVRDFLLVTSILGRMNSSLCDALTRKDNGRAMLEKLVQTNAFLSALDDERHWYRYHHLFAEVLQNRLRQTQPQRLPVLHQQAARWYQENGLVAEAIQHALKAGDEALAVELVEKHAMSMWARGEFTTLLNWIKPLEALENTHPWLGIYKAWTLATTHQLDEVEPVLQKIEPLVRSHPFPAEAKEMEGHIAAIRVYHANLHGDSPRSIEFSKQALAHLPASNLTLRGLVTFFLGYASWAMNDPQAARQAFTEAMDMCLAVDNIYIAVSAVSSMGVILGSEGRLREALETFREALRLATRPDGSLVPAASRMLNNLSSGLYEINELQLVIEYCHKSIELSRYSGQSDPLVTAYMMLARAYRVQRNFEGMLEARREADQILQSLQISHTSGHLISAFYVDFWLREGNLDACRHWMQAEQVGIDDELTNLNETRYIALARVLAACEEFDAALKLIGRMLRRAESAGRSGRVINLLAIQAMAFQGQNMPTQALSALESALSLAEPEGYVRTFLDHDEPMAALLQEITQHVEDPRISGYAARLLALVNAESLTAPAVEGDAGQSAVMLLSERELEVLQLIAAGLTNKQIANELVIAVGTVKRHTANIFNKLDVYNRTEAAARARDLGVL